ncbi:MAG: hypothetical protein M3Q80_00805, partial [bacterium]|nr:hypothetical protein [bacterium]
MVTILSGITARDTQVPKLIEKISTLSVTPTLAIIQVGDRADSSAYITAKKNFAEKIGVVVKHIHLDESATQEEVLSNITKCN